VFNLQCNGQHNSRERERERERPTLQDNDVLLQGLIGIRRETDAISYSFSGLESVKI